MKTKARLTTVVALLGVGLTAGCTPQARQDVSQAGKEVGQATEKSVEGTGQAVENAGQAAEKTAENAGQAIEKGAEKAGQAVETGAERAGEAVGGAAQNAEEAVGGVAREAREGTQNAAAALVLTPKVKNALVADKSIDASTINVDTKSEKDTVVLRGSVRSEAEKKRASTIAQQALKDAKSPFKIKNQLTVAKGNS